MWGTDEKWKVGWKVTETGTHPRILRLYHKMAPTTSSASSSNRNTGRTMEVAPVREQINMSKKGSSACFTDETLSELCDLLPLEVEESTEAAAISHLYPIHPTGHLDTQRARVTKCVCTFQIPYFDISVLLFLLWRTREVSDMGGDKQDQPLQMSFIIFIRNEIKNLEPTSKFQILFLFFQFHRLVKMSDSVLTADLSDKRTIKKKTEGFFITL